jgi:hypothetical protein
MTEPEDERTDYEQSLDYLQHIDETLTGLRFYMVGMFVGITTIGVLYTAFLIYAVVDGRFRG